MVRVAKDLGLRGELLGPLPFLLEFLVEGERVVEAANVAACAGVAVPVPRATDAAGSVEHTGVESEPAEAVEQVHPRKTGADNDDVELCRMGLGLCHYFPPEHGV